MSNNITVLISCPIDTYSGYGARARDFVKQLIRVRPDWDIRILSQRWGETRWGYLDDHNEQDLKKRLITNVQSQPDIFIQITVPNEFQKVGKYNIGLTAGIETTLCDPSWIEGLNKMDLVIVSSKHALEVFKNSKFDLRKKDTNEIVQTMDLSVPIEVLFEGVDPTVYNSTIDPGSKTKQTLDSIPESFCFLATGHWMKGDFGQDRKNIGFTIKAFLETFKNTAKAPALVLKSHSFTTSIIDRDRMLTRISDIMKTVKGSLPNIYLIHGEVSDAEMNQIYAHPKIKAFVSLTKGEGYGRPFLEFAYHSKPIIASPWSGQMDFLDPALTKFVQGTLENVHPSAAVSKILLPEAKWFSPDEISVGKAFKEVWKDYKKWKINGKKQGYRVRKEFNVEQMGNSLSKILDTYVPKFPKQVELNLPVLKKVEDKLPTLKRVDNNE